MTETGLVISDDATVSSVLLPFSNANLIIFDEATSAIDNLTEETVMKNVIALLSGKTVIAIAHRFDSIRAFDNITVFQNGNIAEKGRFDELIEKHHYFHELYNRATQSIEGK